MTMDPNRLHIHPEVQEALKQRRPVVALESTLITHGLPFPVNLEVANGMEKAVRDLGGEHQAEQKSRTLH